MSRLLLSLPLLALAACNPSGTSAKTTGGANDPQAELLAGAPLAPGKWEVTASLTGPPGGAPARTEPPQTSTRCLELKDTIAPTPELFLGSGRACKRDVWNVAGGNINGVLICPGMDDIREVPTRISGRYDRESYNVQSEMSVFGMTIRQTVDAKRIGDCN
ncbi:MAG: hypothetical protein JWN66_4109 [Sphingomonas bacterium]|uniref:DUF3617 domain-containing protein n=1 Tax=Sphingomonas bacterium TaxID=1895847 RepID=UPI0026256A65|nr:DUF3617 family protein [Sphingomonas bacterium]MDB5706993.1 hypothetical protein [Sphingomonas bacterium]